MPPVAPVTATDPLADKNYRIRRLLVKLEVDLYDDDGALLNRVESEQVLPIAEAEFPAGLIDLLIAKTNLARGFVRPAPKPLAAVPDAAVEA